MKRQITEISVNNRIGDYKLNKLVLFSGEVIEGLSWLSKSGKNYVVLLEDSDGLLSKSFNVPIEEIESVSRRKYYEKFCNNNPRGI